VFWQERCSSLVTHAEKLATALCVPHRELALEIRFTWCHHCVRHLLSVDLTLRPIHALPDLCGESVSPHEKGSRQPQKTASARRW